MSDRPPAKTKRDIVEVFIDVLQYFDTSIHDVDRGTYWLRRPKGRWFRDEEYLADVTVEIKVWFGGFFIDVTGRDGVVESVATGATTREEAHRRLSLRFPSESPQPDVTPESQPPKRRGTA